MFGLFKRRTWVPETVAELRGSYRGVEVTLRNIPCLRDAEGGGRKFPFRDFGHQFVERLYEQLGSTASLATRLNMGTAAEVSVKLQSYEPIWVALRGKADRNIGQFQSDIADALIEAFKSGNLQPS